MKPFIINDDELVLIINKSDFTILMEELNQLVENEQIQNEKFWDLWNKMVQIEEELI